MSVIPNRVSRLGYRSALKFKANSPTIMVVAGVVGLGATAVLAARATRHIDPIIEVHSKERIALANERAELTSREYNKRLYTLYMGTGFELGKLYGPALFVGTTSAISILGGHKILRSRQIATMAAYSGLLEQFNSYRVRVAQTVGEDIEKGIYEGARGEWHKENGQANLPKQMTPVFEDKPDTYLTPWFTSQTSPNHKNDPVVNYLFLKSVQTHMNHMLSRRGHVFLNDVYDALGMARRPEGAVAGWLYNNPNGDQHIDFGFMTGIDPNTKAFREGFTNEVQLNFNIDGTIWDQI